MSSSLTFDLTDGIARVTINRPDKLNALNAIVIAELGDAVTRIETDPAIRGVIVTGTGSKAFVAGADISEIAALDERSGTEFSRRGQLVFDAIESLGKPVIAAVNGHALGGGCELALVCMVRVASENAMFGQPEVKLGLIPGYGGTQRLPRLVGTGRALRLLLTGETITAAEALRLGLIDEIVPAAMLLNRAEALARQIAANAPLALKFCIDAVNRGFTEEAVLFGKVCGTEDMKEGTRAFLEKRAPEFKGR